MLSGINSYSTYYKLFSSPIKSYEANPVSNQIYGASVTALYSKKFNTILQKEMTGYLHSFDTKVSSLKEASKSLQTNAKDSVFGQKDVASGDTSVAMGSAKDKAQMKTYDIQVTQLAKSQENKGFQFDSSSLNHFTAGTHSFELSKGGKSMALQLEVKSYQSNKEVLYGIQDKINQSNFGIKANVYQQEDGKAYLKLSSEKTGEENAFSIQDVTGDLMASTGLMNVSQNAQNAKYKINGEEKSAGTNEVSLDNGNVTLSLKSIGETSVSVVQDKEEILSGIKEFVNQYNEMNDFLGSYAQPLQNSIKYKESAMESIGIHIQQDGSLKINESKLTEAVEKDTNKISDLFGGSFGVASQIHKAVETKLSDVKQMVLKNEFLDQQKNQYIYQYSQMAQKQFFYPFIQPGALFNIYS